MLRVRTEDSMSRGSATLWPVWLGRGMVLWGSARGQRFGVRALKEVTRLWSRAQSPGDRTACRGAPPPPRHASGSTEGPGNRGSGGSHTPPESPTLSAYCSSRRHEVHSMAYRDTARFARGSNDQRVPSIHGHSHRLPEDLPVCLTPRARSLSRSRSSQSGQ